MPTETPTKTFYGSYNLEPCQCVEWLISQSGEALSHTIMAFGWMSSRPDTPHSYHVARVREQIARCRELLTILEAHVDRPAPVPVEKMTADQNEIQF